MKKITLMLSALVFVMVTSCEVESIDQEIAELSQDAKGKAKKNKPKNNDQPDVPIDVEVDLEDLGDSCTSVTLIAGQHHTAGDVTIYKDGDYLIFVFSTADGWDLGTTHLSVGNCDEDWVPLTGSGNPKIGNFQYTDPYFVSEDEVIYVVPLEGLDEEYCFAAHAEVQGPTGGETAWGEGTEFATQGWATYSEATLAECPEDDDDGGDDDEDPCCIPV